MMTNEPPKKVKITAASDLEKLLSDAAARPIVLEKNGELYRLERMEHEGTMLSPEEIARSRAGILQAAGSWKDIDTKAFKAYISDRHHTANRPSVKL